MSVRIELHLHLEGGAGPGFIRRLADEKKRTMPDILDEAGAYRFASFREFLQVYEATASMIETPQDYARLVKHVLGNAAEHGAAYVELFISPEYCGKGDLSAWREYLAAMDEAATSMRAAGVDSRAIVTCVRHLGPERARRAALCAAETGDATGIGWVTGFGMGGAENIGKPTDFAWAFDCAREAGLGLTCHAGEWSGPESIREALALGVSRIGHGIRAVEDSVLLRDMARRKIMFEVCPGSNIALGLFADWPSHPIAQLMKAGCRVSVSTDDPPFFQTDLSNEYNALSKAFGWGDTMFTRMNRWAAEAAFCDEDTRKRLITAIEKDSK